MASQTLEGTWEEIAAHADELADKHLKVIYEADVERADAPNVGPPNVGPPNEKMLNILREIEEHQKGMRYTSGEDTQDLLRQARNGGMYGDEPAGG